MCWEVLEKCWKCWKSVGKCWMDTRCNSTRPEANCVALRVQLLTNRMYFRVGDLALAP